jgi:uncharacterized membrane protein YfcA
MTPIIVSCFFIAFFCESAIGFGGLMISFSLLSFFLDIKDLIPITVYVGIVASSFILFTDRKSIEWELLIKKIAPFAFIGTIIGVMIIDKLDSAVLLKVFSIFIIVVSVKSLLLSKSRFYKYIKIPTLICGGLMQGIYGIGGPFTILAMQNDFTSKSHLRSTLAVYFIFFNIIRMIQFKITGIYGFRDVFAMWWLIVPLGIAIFLGYKLHVRIPETLFKKIINILLLLAGISFLLK